MFQTMPLGPLSCWSSTGLQRGASVPWSAPSHHLAPTSAPCLPQQRPCSESPGLAGGSPIPSAASDPSRRHSLVPNDSKHQQDKSILNLQDVRGVTALLTNRCTWSSHANLSPAAPGDGHPTPLSCTTRRDCMSWKACPATPPRRSKGHSPSPTTVLLPRHHADVAPPAPSCCLSMLPSLCLSEPAHPGTVAPSVSQHSAPLMPPLHVETTVTASGSFFHLNESIMSQWPPLNGA